MKRQFASGGLNCVRAKLRLMSEVTVQRPASGKTLAAAVTNWFYTTLNVDSELYPMATRPAAKKPAAKSAPVKAAPARKAAAKQPAAAAKKPAPVVVSLKAVFEQLAETHELSKKQAQAMQADLVGTLTQHLKQGARIRMSGLGTLEVRQRAARMGRNPATGEAIEIKASKKIAFRPAKELKDAV